MVTAAQVFELLEVGSLSARSFDPRRFFASAADSDGLAIPVSPHVGITRQMDVFKVHFRIVQAL